MRYSVQKEYIQTQDYCLSVRDGTHDTPKPVAIGKPLVTSKAINNNNIDFSVTYNISEKDFNKINKRSLVEKWDLLMTMIGTVGRLHIVKNCPDYAIKNIALFKIKDAQKAKWLYYYLSLKEVQTYFQSIANGTSQHFIPLNVLRKLKIENYNVHSPRIINILSTYDDLIEKNNRKIAILQEMAEELYKEWFVRFRFPNYKTAKFHEGIPSGWKQAKLGEFITFIRGIGYSSEDIQTGADILLSMNNIKPFGGFIRDYSRVYSGKYKEGQVVKENDLIMSITDMTQDRRIIGYVGMVPHCKKRLIICTHLIKLTSEKYENSFLCGLFNYSGLSRQISERATGANVLGLTANILKNVKTLLPPDDLIKRYTKIVDPIYKNISNLEDGNELLTQQRDLLLPRLMSGKLEVKA